jgi:hypothetical protein
MGKRGGYPDNRLNTETAEHRQFRYFSSWDILNVLSIVVLSTLVEFLVGGWRKSSTSLIFPTSQKFFYFCVKAWNFIEFFDKLMRFITFSNISKISGGQGNGRKFPCVLGCYSTFHFPLSTLHYLKEIFHDNYFFN